MVGFADVGLGPMPASLRRGPGPSCAGPHPRLVRRCGEPHPWLGLSYLLYFDRSSHVSRHVTRASVLLPQLTVMEPRVRPRAPMDGIMATTRRDSRVTIDRREFIAGGAV